MGFKYCSFIWMKGFLFILSCLYTISVLGQSGRREFNIPNSYFGVSEYRDHQKLMNQLQLPDLYFAKNSFRFRYRQQRSIVEIWSEDNIHYEGRMVLFLTRDHYKRSQITKREVMYEYVRLDSVIVSKLLKEISESEILKVETDEHVNGWRYSDNVPLLLSCGSWSYYLEHTGSGEYYFKTFAVPEQYTATKEAILVSGFTKKLNSIVSLDTRFEAFFNLLPKGVYNFDVIQVQKLNGTKRLANELGSRVIVKEID